MPALTPLQISAIDAAHLWHPYSTIGAEAVPPVVAVGARGAWLTLIRDGESIDALDAMSSWWTAIHGHGHPVLDAALTKQLSTMNHVMFGGLTHEPPRGWPSYWWTSLRPRYRRCFSATPGRCRSKSR
ncbi:aminotransferase class-III family protein [Mycobacterium xenopi 3993]|nr:aminotransferase class-III family protein [Mycobacterium xenopi 3993]